MNAVVLPAVLNPTPAANALGYDPYHGIAPADDPRNATPRTWDGFTKVLGADVRPGMKLRLRAYGSVLGTVKRVTRAIDGTYDVDLRGGGAINVPACAWVSDN